MNNDLILFKIAFSGAILDDKKYFQYDLTTYPTYTQSVTKAIAYNRLQEVKKAISTTGTPLYVELTHTTAGTSVEVPVETTLVVGYKSLEHLVFSGYNTTAVTPTTTDTDMKNMACAVLKSLVEDVLQSDYVIGSEVSNPVVRAQVAGGATSTYNQNKYELVAVPALTGPTSTATVTTIVIG